MIVDTDQKKSQAKRRVLGYQLQKKEDQKRKPNHVGWVWLPPVDVWLGIEDNEPYCYDELGQKISDYPQIYLNMKWEKQMRAKAQEQAESEAGARAKAEEQAASEAGARAKAEKEAADQEAKLRQMEVELRRLRNQD